MKTYIQNSFSNEHTLFTDKGELVAREKTEVDLVRACAKKGIYFSKMQAKVHDTGTGFHNTVLWFDQ